MANLKNTTIDDNLELPQGTTDQRPNSPAEGMIRYNTDINDIEYYSGNDWYRLSDTNPVASGGNVVDTAISGNDYRYHWFSQVGNYSLTVEKGGYADVLVVAGGGGGGDFGGGGGAGGVIFRENYVLTAGTYTITVGDGGQGAVGSSENNGEKGEDSVFANLTAQGGGAGQGDDQGSFNISGGSGGGGKRGDPGGAGTTGQGNSGGAGVSTDTYYRGGGGGGAGQQGGTSERRDESGDGGNGLYLGNIFSSYLGEHGWIAGGGGGGAVVNSYADDIRGGRAGLGGGGKGGDSGSGGQSNQNPGQPGIPASGGGGGSASYQELGGKGGSGVVVIRYKKNANSSNPDRTLVNCIPKSNMPRVPRNNLLFYIDPANPNSYPGSGSTVYNLSPELGNASLESGATFDNNQAGGVFDLTGGSDHIITPVVRDQYPDITMSFWFRFTGQISDGYGAIIAADNGDFFVGKNRGSNDNGDNFGIEDGPYQSSFWPNAYVWNGDWWFVTYINDAGTGRLYINGNQEASNSIGPGTGNQLALGGEGSSWSGSQFTGYIGFAAIHQGVLSQTDIEDMFYTTKWRYGK